MTTLHEVIRDYQAAVPHHSPGDALSLLLAAAEALRGHDDTDDEWEPADNFTEAPECGYCGGPVSTRVGEHGWAALCDDCHAIEMEEP